MPQPLFRKGQLVPLLYKTMFDYEMQVWTCTGVREDTGECLLVSPNGTCVTIVRADGTLSNEDTMFPDETGGELTKAESDELDTLQYMFVNNVPMTPEQTERLEELELKELRAIIPPLP